MRHLLVFAALSVAALSGCASTRQIKKAEPIPASATARKASVDHPPAPSTRGPSFGRQVVGRSVEGRDIVMTSFGGGAAGVLVIGGIHGNENSSVTVAQELARLLAARPEKAVRSPTAILENANPDGFSLRKRNNSRGVDINRNFPAKNFRPSRGGVVRSGAAAASEPETLAILKAIELTNPRLIIAIHSIDAGKQCNNYDGPAQAVAEAMSRHNGYPAAASMGYPTPGSLGSFAGIDRNIGVITLELPRNLSGDQAWRANREALLAALAAAQ